MPRINRRARTLAQPRRPRVQVLELLLGPNGESVFRSEEHRQEVWNLQRREISDEFAAQWYVAQPMPKPFSTIAAQYAHQVVTGERPACQWVKLACQRHLDDLDRAKGDWLYEFDSRKADRVCRFIEMLPHVKGIWAANGELLKLEPWQIFIVCVLFGWLKKATGTRRFTIAYIEVARKSAKSALAAAIGDYMAFCDGEFGAEVYSGATSEDQAHEVYRPAKQMMERSPELARVLSVRPTARVILGIEDGSRFETVIGKPGDGASPHCGIIDEYHEHESDALFDTLRTGMGARRQPMLFVITTAGDNTAGPCKLLQGDVCKVLDGSFQRDEMFGVIYTIDTGDDWTSERSLEKCSPNLDVSVSREFLLAERNAALASPRKQGVFQTKYECVWVGSIASYFDAHRWKQLADSSLKDSDFVGLPCVMAVDLSTKRDFTARVWMFKKVVKGKDHYYAFSRFYLPQERVDLPANQHYQGWAKLGKLIAHAGATVDFEAIQAETIADINRFRAREFAFDDWNAHQFAQGVRNHTKAVAVEIDQNAKSLSPAMKELDTLIAEGRIHHDGNPVMDWMIGNVKAQEDKNENVFPHKEKGREENKIDGAVGLIMDVSRLMLAPAKKSIYATRGFLTLDDSRQMVNA